MTGAPREWIVMRIVKFTRRRTKAFFTLLAFFFFPPAIYFLPFEGPVILIKMLVLIPTILWTTLPAILFSQLASSLYEFKEFGAIPQNEIGWGLIIFFWFLVFFVSLREKEREPQPSPDRVHQ